MTMEIYDHTIKKFIDYTRKDDDPFIPQYNNHGDIIGWRCSPCYMMLDKNGVCLGCGSTKIESERKNGFGDDGK